MSIINNSNDLNSFNNLYKRSIVDWSESNLLGIENS